MEFPYPTSRLIYRYQRPAISRSWFFRFASLAFIAMVTPALAFSMHGFAGFVLILILAIIAGLVEGTFNQALHSISEGISRNKTLFTLIVWYFIGFILNILIRGNGLDNWRLILSPLAILMSLLYTFAFMRDDRCHRYFQIGLMIITGIQTAFSVQVLIETPDIARVMWAETSGAWIYGNQYIYATYAVTTPILLWRSFRESGLLRLLLLTSCIFILITTSISSFGTSLGLVILSGLIISALSLFMLRRSFGIALLVMVVISAVILFGYQATYDNPLFSQAYYRIENFIRNPQSGGYIGSSSSASRWYLAEISINTFQSEPFLGTGGPREYNPYIGGHSSFFDSLAIYGLFGGGGAFSGIVFFLLANTFRQFWRKRNWETLLALTSAVLLITVGIADPFWEKLIPLGLILLRPFRCELNKATLVNPRESFQFRQKYD